MYLQVHQMSSSTLENLASFFSRYVPFPAKEGAGASIYHEPLSSTAISMHQPASAFDSSVIRIAGLSGSLAVVIGAYGAHALRQYAINDERRLRAFETGNRYHLLHSVALLGSARARFPLLTASLFLAGIVIFSSTCYHYSITGEETFRRYTPVGGVLFIIAWLSFVF
uniref:Transmembrane protein 256 n=1 Tax=Ascaris suum TaxID=6253 RepID=F1L716_ASCSU